MRKKMLIVFALALSFQMTSGFQNREDCGLMDGGNTRIFGGTETDIDEYPWMVLISYTNTLKNGWSFDCGGSIISPRYVLTAAHCVANLHSFAKRLRKIRIGDHNIMESKDCDNRGNCNIPKDVAASRIIIHEDYDPDTLANDIALIKLRTTLRFNKYVRPICLPTSSFLSSNSFRGYNLNAAGWGFTENRMKSYTKLKVTIPVTVCQNQRPRSTIICAGANGRDSCNGDSGGPLMGQVETGSSKWYLLGIVSYGLYPCGSKPAAYTRVGAYIDWIQNHLH